MFIETVYKVCMLISFVFLGFIRHRSNGEWGELWEAREEGNEGDGHGERIIGDRSEGERERESMSVIVVSGITSGFISGVV